MYRISRGSEVEEDENFFPFSLRLKHCLQIKVFYFSHHSHPSEIGYWHSFFFLYLPNNIYLNLAPYANILKRAKMIFFIYIYLSHLIMKKILFIFQHAVQLVAIWSMVIAKNPMSACEYQKKSRVRD